MQMGTNSTAYYISVASSSIANFFDEMYLNTPWEQHYNNLDGRTILDRLASVKYFVVKKGKESDLPYGYSRLSGEAEKNGKTYLAYADEDALPLGYTYDSWISREDYDKMTVTEKQQALLQGVVLDDSSLPETETHFNDREVSYYTSEGKGCRLKNGKVVVTQENAQLKLVFEGEENAETYLITEGLDYEGLSPREMISDKKWSKMTTYEQNKLLEENSNWRYWKESQKASIQIGGRFLKKTIQIFTDKYNAYSGKHNFLCNTGYSEKGRHTITLTFENTGVYSFDSLKIYCQPMTEIDSQTSKLGEEVLTDVKIGNNEINGKISLSDTKALVLSIPYSEGWTAYVDGEETELKEANTMYMALELPKGDHEIHLVYCTPYLRTGLCLTCIGVLCYIVLVLINRKKKRF